MKIYETTTHDGTLVPISLELDGDALVLVSGVSGEEALPLPNGALEAVMARFAKPLEPTERLVDVDALAFGDGRRLRHVRHLAHFDVIALDWLLYEAPASAPVCALATTVAAALGHLARAYASSSS